MSAVRQVNINDGVPLARATEGSVIVDVRTEEEYEKGHVPGSINIPSLYIQRLAERLSDLETPLFLYCRSGARSKRSSHLLLSVGYTNITDMGGITHWTGPLEK